MGLVVYPIKEDVVPMKETMEQYVLNNQVKLVQIIVVLVGKIVNTELYELVHGMLPTAILGVQKSALVVVEQVGKGGMIVLKVGMTVGVNHGMLLPAILGVEKIVLVVIV
jgi:hypothetical protein